MKRDKTVFHKGFRPGVKQPQVQMLTPVDEKKRVFHKGEKIFPFDVIDKVFVEKEKVAKDSKTIYVNAINFENAQRKAEQFLKELGFARWNALFEERFYTRVNAMCADAVKNIDTFIDQLFEPVCPKKNLN